MFTQTATATALGLKTVTWLERALDNRADCSELDGLRDAFYARARLENHRAEQRIAGYRTLRERIGRSVRRYPPSPLALHAQFQRRQALLPVNPAVDIYNLVSLVTGLSIGAHDLAAVAGNVRLDTTRGDEVFYPLGSATARPVPAGEYAYLDEQDRVLCRMEYRQSAHSCVTRDSRDCLFIVQGHSGTGHELLLQTAQQVSDLLKTWCSARTGERWFTP